MCDWWYGGGAGAIHAARVAEVMDRCVRNVVLVVVGLAEKYRWLLQVWKYWVETRQEEFMLPQSKEAEQEQDCVCSREQQDSHHESAATLLGVGLERNNHVKQQKAKKQEK